MCPQWTVGENKKVSNNFPPLLGRAGRHIVFFSVLPLSSIPLRRETMERPHENPTMETPSESDHGRILRGSPPGPPRVPPVSDQWSPFSRVLKTPRDQNHEKTSVYLCKSIKKYEKSTNYLKERVRGSEEALLETRSLCIFAFLPRSENSQKSRSFCSFA